ncbi:hypothetical protein D1872_318990 [compost metagenome]
MRPHFLALADPPFELHQGIAQHRYIGRAVVPQVPGKTLGHRHLGHAGEVTGQFFLLATQHVDAQMAVGAEHVVGGAVAVDAHQHGWR